MFLFYFLVLFSNIYLLLVTTGLRENTPCNEYRTRRHSSLEKCYEDIRRISVRRSITPIYEDNWQQLICGEWLVLLCSQLDWDCRDLKRILQRLPDTTEDVGLAFGDLSKETTLQARMHAFDPITLYHVIGGDFRRLDCHQDVFSLRDILLLRQWTEIPPALVWKHPTSRWTNFYVFLHKAAVKLLKSGYVGNSFNVAKWCINFALVGALITGVWIIYLLWCSILFICHYLKRRQSPYPALLPAPTEE